jgi:hypothetical protein
MSIKKSYTFNIEFSKKECEILVDRIASLSKFYGETLPPEKYIKWVVMRSSSKDLDRESVSRDGGYLFYG